MPSFRADGFKLIIYARDEKGHRPHCHVRYAGARVAIRLDGTFYTYGAVGMKPKDIKRALNLVAIYLERLKQMWDETVEGADRDMEMNQE